MDDFLELVVSERAEELRVCAGAPPVIVIRGERHVIEGPELTAENTDMLLRSVADTRQMRELRESGRAEFIHTFRKSSCFVVRARMEDEIAGFEMQRVVT